MDNKKQTDMQSIMQGMFAGADFNGAQIIAYNAGEVVYKKCTEREDIKFSLDDIFNKKAGGIGDRSEFWLLLIAASARRIVFDSIPQFIEGTFNKMQIPFDKEECHKSTREALKGQAWSSVDSQEKMLEFIKNKYNQTGKCEQMLALGNRLFVALKENPWGKS